MAVLVGLVLSFALWQAVKWARATWKSPRTTPLARWFRVATLVVLSSALTAVLASQVVAFSDAGPATTETRGIPKLVDLGSKVCLPCQQMAPILDELTREYVGQFDVEFIDVGLPENQQRAHQYGIRLIPTQIFFNAEGHELWRHEGFLGKAEILAKWSELGLPMEPIPADDTAPSVSRAQ